MYFSVISLCLFLFLTGESVGTSSFFLGPSYYAQYIFYIPLIISVFISLMKLFNQRSDSSERRYLFSIAVVSLFATFWIGLSSIVNGNSLNDVVREVLFSNIYCIPIILAYCKEKNACVIFCITIGVQLIIGTLITMFPDSVFSLMSAPRELSERVTINSLEETLQSRDAAQFGNTLQLAFYGAVGLIIGIYILRKITRNYLKIIAIFMIAMGIWIECIAFSRGIWLGLIFGFLVVLFRARNIFIILLVTIVCFVLFCEMIEYTKDLSLQGPMQEIVSRFSEIVDSENVGINYRINALKHSAEVLVDDPVFGVGSVEALVNLIGGAPHQAPILYTLVFGFPVGVIVLYFIWKCIALDVRLFKNRLAGLCIEEKNLISMLGWLTLFLSFTNGFAGGMLCWIVIAICVTWSAGNKPPRKI